MAKTAKTDNTNLAAKLDLRRYFLRKYHAGSPIHVLDCCQGDGLIWSRLRQEFELASYWGLDLKPKKGRLKLDSSRVLSQPGWPQNVVDVDTYGSPWKHWEAMLPNVSQPTTIFLTVGQCRMVGGFQSYHRETVKAAGINERIRRACPPTLLRRVGELGMSHCLHRYSSFRLELIEAMEAVAEESRNARYLGVRLGAVNQGDPGC